MFDCLGGFLGVTGWLLIAVVTLIIIWYWSKRQKFMLFEKRGIKGPSPNIILGNTDLFIKKGFVYAFKEWGSKYGKVYGTFRGSTPSLIVSDLDLVREVMVKKFNSFPNRQKPTLNAYKPWIDMMLFLRDDHWKHVRDKLSPIFSSGKLKKMIPVIQRCCRDLVGNVEALAKSGEEIDAKKLSNGFTMDVIAGAGFGIEVNSLKNPKDPFIKLANRILYPPNWMVSLLIAFPYLSNFFRYVGITIAPEKDTNVMINILNDALKARRQEKQKYHDMLQHIVDLEKEQGQKLEIDPEIDHSTELSKRQIRAQSDLTDDEINSNSFVFLLAGYETTSSALSFLLFNLAGNPSCLEECQKEIDKVLGDREVDYEITNQLPYMEMCINESLRLYPPGFILDRDCEEETPLGDIVVPSGSLVTIPVHAIHTNPEYWTDPDKYDPLRHTAEARAKRHPYSFIPFGYGPRNCIGMRLALIELKMATAAILQKFTPELVEKSVYPAKIANHFRLNAADGLPIKFKPRA